jgi:hypothetical protein
VKKQTRHLNLLNHQDAMQVKLGRIAAGMPADVNFEDSAAAA